MEGPSRERGKVRASELYSLYSGSVFLALSWKVPRSDAARARGGRDGRGSGKVAASPLYVLRFLPGWGGAGPRGAASERQRLAGLGGGGWEARGRRGGGLGAGRGSRAGRAEALDPVAAATADPVSE